MKMVKDWRLNISVLIICLIITMPFSYAQFDFATDEAERVGFEEEETGASIIVQVNSYEPRIVPSNILEEDDAPIYAFLSAITPGSLLAETAGITSGSRAESQAQQLTAEPFISAPDIRTVVIRPLDESTSNFIRGNPRYIRPRQYSLDNLGYLMILLRQVETEEELPEEITLNMEAEIWFENAERLFSLVQQDLVLPLDPDEQLWRSKRLHPDYSFFAGRGYVRTSDISGSSAQFVVYSGNDISWPYTGGTPRPIRSLSLNVGETSDFIRLQETGELIQNAFRVKLVDIIDQTQERAKVTVEADGRLQEFVVAEGSRLFPGSEWTVNSIDVSETGEGTKYELTISSANDRRIISTVYPKGTIEQEEEDPCEKAVVLLGNLAAREVPSQQLSRQANGELSSSSVFSLTSMRQLGVTEFAGFRSNILPAGRYLAVTNVESNSATIRFDNLEVDVQRSSGWIETGRTLLQTFLNEIRTRFGAAEQEFTLRQGSTRRITAEDTTYQITIDSIDAQRDAVRISVAKSATAQQGIAEIRPTVTISTNRPSADVATDLEKTSRDFVLCTAIKEYKKILTDYQGIKNEENVLLSDIAAFKIGEIYEELGYPKLALRHYLKSLENGRGDFIVDAQNRVTRLETLAEQGARLRTASVLDNGRDVKVRAGSMLGDPGAVPKATLEIDGREKKLVLGEKIFTEDVRVAETRESPAFSYNWKIKELGEDFIVVEKYATSGTLPTTFTSRLFSQFSERETINLRETELIEEKPVKLLNIDTQKFALVRIIPGTGRPLVSKSNFTLHIPIEKRAIRQTPSEISAKINSTEDIIRDLDNVINKLDKIVRVWKQVCLITFAYLTLKNSFLTGFSRTQARRLAMRGQDGSSGWNAYCQENSGIGKAYRTYDDCINKNLDRISDSIDESQDAIELVNDEMEDYQNQPWFNQLTKDYKQLDKYGEFSGDLFNPQTLRDYRYWQLMKQKRSYSELTGQREEVLAYNFKSEVDRQLDSFKFDQKLQQYNNAVNAISERYPNFDGLPEQDKKEVFRDLMRVSSADVSSEEFVFMGDLATTQLPSIRRDESGVYANTQSGRVPLSEATVQDYLKRLDKEKLRSPGSANDIQNEINRVNRNYERNPLAPLISSGGQVYVDTQDNFYVADTLAFSTGQTREDYASGATVEIYPDGRPYCIPSGDGNYVKILDFFQDDSPRTIQEWNVGSDGLLCTQDDVLLRHQSVLARPENADEQNRLLELASRIGRRRIGEVVSAAGKNFRVDDRLSRSQQNVNAPKCFDVMDPSDCQTLFGVCDPVMCPPSRFNLGGTWQVDNVVQTGLVGSLVLGLHNFNAREPVPICLTGVLAGLRNIKSILQGYVECLKVAQATGRAVGICDTIRSIFTCELIWREATAIFKARGSIFKWIGQRVFGETEEGGEYLTFQQSFQNVEDSVNFFTREYAAQSFAAYNARSSEDIGSSICRAAIYGRAPEIGEMIEQLSVPESPPQYIATLSIAPYSDVLQQSRYSVYYHIYAGETQPVDYSVFLKSEIGDTFYTTERCRGRTGHIEKGGIADATIDCVTSTGLKEVCITVNGITKCGFGKVTTDFGLNYLNDLVVQGDVRRQIDSEEECVAGESQGSPALLGAGIASAVGLPYATETARAGLAARDLSTTGVIRVCSVQNPGRGTNPHDYKVVGTCGKDATGRVLGNCWIDLRTVTIKDAEEAAEISEQLEEQTVAAERERLGITNTIDREQSKRSFDEIELLDKSTCIKTIDSLKQYDDLSTRSVSYEISGKARMRVAEQYEYLARNCAKADPFREFNRLIVELERSLQTVVNAFNNNVDQARTELANNPTALNAAITRESEAAISQMSQLEREYNARVATLSLESTGDVSVASIVQAFKARISSGETITAAPLTRTAAEINAESIACRRCGEGAFNQCDDNECHGINQNCYFFERVAEVLGVDVADVTGNNECQSCARANDCSSFDFDRNQCQSQRCTSQSGLKCSWLQIGGTGKCVPDTGVSRSAERITRTRECSGCGGLFNPCDEEECHDNGANCYHKPGTVVGGDCSSCESAQSCEDFDGDKSRCNNYEECTISIGKRCRYDDEEEKCKESISQPAAVSGAVTVTTPDYGTMALDPSTQCGSDDNCVFMEDASRSERGRAIDMVVIHTTDGRRAINTHNLFSPAGERSGLSVNYILDRPGNYIQEVDERFGTHHTSTDANRRSVGIEISNSGAQCIGICGGSNPPDCARSDCIEVQGQRPLFEQFSQAQMKALVRLVSEILIRNNLQVSNIRQHGKKFEDDECAPAGLSDERGDPGPLFDWCKFNRNVQAAIDQYRARAITSQPVTSTIGGRAPQWTFVRTQLGEDFSSLHYDQNTNYAISEVIGEYLKNNKQRVSASDRQRYINAITENAQKYNVHPYVIAASIESESNWVTLRKETESEHSYGPMHCNLGRQQPSEAAIAEIVSIEGGIDCGTKAIANLINRFGAETFGDIRAGYNYGPNVGGAGRTIPTFQRNNRDPCAAFASGGTNDKCLAQRRRWPEINALIKRLIQDAQRVVGQSPTQISRETDTDAISERTTGRSIAVMGDSITSWGGEQPNVNEQLDCNTVTFGGTSYVTTLRERCTDVGFTNLGISGQGTSQMLARYDEQVLNCNYGEIIILAGVNDMGRSLDEIKNNLANMYRQAKQKGLKVIAVTVLPWRGYSSWSEAKQTKTEDLNAWIKSKPENVDIVVDAYSSLNDPNNNGHLKPGYGGPLHPNSEGQKAVADAIISAAYRNECR